MTQEHLVERLEPPEELNRQFQHILNVLPKIDFPEELSMEDDAYTASLIHRGNSEFGERVMDKVIKLVDKASITEKFKDFIFNEFRECKDDGIILNNSDYINDIFFFLDLNIPMSGGIFDTNRAKHLERVAIAKSLMQIIRAQESYNRFKARLGWGDDSEEIAGLREEKWQSIQAWKTQFKSLYSEEL